MELDVLVQNVWSYLNIDKTMLDRKILKDIEKEMSYIIQEYVRSRKTYVDLEYTLFERGKMRYPTGLISNLGTVLDKNNIAYNIYDQRKLPVSKDKLIIHGKTLRDYQEETVEKSLKAERGIVKIATGGGKTTIAAGIIAKLNIKTLFMVHTVDLLEQAYDEFKSMLQLDIGRVGGGYCDIKQINVCTIQTLHKALGLKYEGIDNECHVKEKTSKKVLDRKEEIREMIESAELIINDECQHSKASSYVNMMKAAKSAYYKFGLSATPYKYDSSDIILNAYSGREIISISASYLIYRNFLVPPKIYFLDPNRLGGYQYVHGRFDKVYKEWIVENQLRNNLISDCVERLLNLDKTVLITVTQVKHGELVMKTIDRRLSGVKASFIHGEVKSDKRKELLNDIRHRDLKVLVGTSLKYDETIWIKNKGYINLVKIGVFVEWFKKNIGLQEIDGYETLSLYDNKVCWKKITHVSKHLNETQLVDVRLKTGRNVFVTDNHSLISYDDDVLSSKTPTVGCGVIMAKKHEMTNNINKLNLVELFYLNFNNPSLEIRIGGITQAKVRLMRTEYEFLNGTCKSRQQGVNKLDDSTILRVKKRLKDKDAFYLEFVKWFNENVYYYKGYYRTTLEKALGFKYLEKLDGKICWRRSRKNFQLPLFLDNTKELAMLCGFFVSEGNTKVSKRSERRMTFSAKKYGDEYDNFGKENNRKLFISCLNKVFPNLSYDITNNKIVLSGHLITHFFKEIIDIGGLAPHKRVPHYIYNSSREIQMSFLHGYFLGDGSYDSKERRFTFTTTSRFLVDGLIGILLNNGFESIGVNLKNSQVSMINGRKIQSRNKCYSVRVRGNLFGIGEKLRLDKYKKYRVNDDFDNFPIVSINDIENDKYVYDISVEDSECFFNGKGILCHNTVADEGLDLPALDSAIIAGGGKSLIKSLQRVGRTLRPYENKKEAIVVDFYDHLRYLTGHSKKRMQIYKQEPKFQIFKDF